MTERVTEEQRREDTESEERAERERERARRELRADRAWHIRRRTEWGRKWRWAKS